MLRDPPRQMLRFGEPKASGSNQLSTLKGAPV